MSASQYIELVEAGADPGIVGSQVAALPIEQRKQLRDELESLNYQKLVRTLWYCYETQRFF